MNIYNGMFSRNPFPCPCRECKNRKVGCHGTCQLYKEWKEKRVPLKRGI